ncbi:MAG: RNA-binding transcriptional accessory protein [Deltaproteobacteria bacterium]|nr:RNA-binding transcriptional accessory protein [Deltaproteobacteria bacterium]
MMDLISRLTQEFQLKPIQVKNTLELLDSDNTIPFIARYRKEATGELDEVQIRDIRDRALYLREMEDRRGVILVSIEEQGKLTDDLRAKILAADTKQALEDLYLPYRPKRRTRAMAAREKGLEPLARAIFEGNHTDTELESLAAAFLAGFEGEITPEEIWGGCRDIYAEVVADDADTRSLVRQLTHTSGRLVSVAAKDYIGKPSKFTDYYEFSEPVAKIPAHRYLAVSRGEKEGVLRLKVEVEEGIILEAISRRWGTAAQGRARQEWGLVIQDAWHRLVSPAVEVDIRMALKEAADTSSISMFSENMKNLLLSPPGGQQVMMGLDPGLRTGTKWVVINKTGRLVAYGTIYPLPPKKDVQGAMRTLLEAIGQHGVEVIALGNGTGSRETLAFARQMVEAHHLKVVPLMVNESGASVYSASDLAREEFPDLDVTIRGAVSIARRYQDPLAELVKIDPKAVGVGQYQHDVNQTKLKQSLDDTVESCVNFVGVNLNTASAALLRYVSGIGPSLAKSIVAYRDGHGPFATRMDLEKVPGLGPKAFEQCAGFLRIPDGTQPLDNSAVHPERYAVVEKMARDLSVSLAQMVANDTLLNTLKLDHYVEGEVGLPTLADIVAELKKPGRDPRKDHKAVEFAADITEVRHLTPGMKLNGVVTNITHFGAFVDIGVHQDGLVHVSQLADTFVADPAKFVKVGQGVLVTVVEVDQSRNRIALSMRTHPEADKTRTDKSPRKSEGTPTQAGGQPQERSQPQTGRPPNRKPPEKTKPAAAPLPPMSVEEAMAALNSKFRG